MLRTPQPEDAIVQWFSVKLSGYLSRRGVITLKDLSRVIVKLKTIPGIGKAGCERIEQVWRAMDAGYGLPLVGDDEASLDGCFEPMALPEPTRSHPGSAAKVEELAKRFEAGQALWHPDDLSYKDSIRDYSMFCMRQRADSKGVGPEFEESEDED